MSREQREPASAPQAAGAQLSLGRRAFLGMVGGAAALVGGGALAWPALATPRTAPEHGRPLRPELSPELFRGRVSVLDQLNRSIFESHLNEEFGVAGADGQVTLTLVRAIDGRYNDPERGLEQFSLTFRGPAASPLEQGTFEFKHPALGIFPLFIVPLGQDEHGHYYQAVFNRLPRK